MRMLEYQAKGIFKEYGLPIPRGKVAETPEEAREIAKSIGSRVTIKAQIPVGGRGKAGGIKFSDTPEEAEKVTKEMLGMKIKDFTVKKVLVEERVDIEKEYYVGFVIDPSSGQITAIMSSIGGVDIEEVAKKMPEKVIKQTVDPNLGLLDFQARSLAYNAGIDKEAIPGILDISKKLYKIFLEKDAMLAEINPLVLKKDRSLVGLDAKLEIDDNALMRHPELIKYMETDESERISKEKGFHYVKLEGNIGVIGNGAGLVMTTIDLIHDKGGKAANFLDIGGGARAERVRSALGLLLSDERINAILLNIYGGITRCDEVARGIREALGDMKVNVPIVVRLAGTNEIEGKEILRDTDLILADTMEDAAEKVVELSKKS